MSSLHLFLIGALGLSAVVLSGCQTTRHTTESPAYDVIAKHGDIEVRRYNSRVVAETQVEVSDQSKASSEGFRRLAGFIFGGNTKADGSTQEIAMTSPVEATPARSQEIAMTSPVEASPEPSGGWTIAFTMPREITLANAPTPNDDRVTLRELPPETVAVYTFSGRVNAADFDEARAKLLNDLEKTDYQPTGTVTLARYDPPWTLPFLRRNEVVVPVQPTDTPDDPSTPK